MKKLLLALSVLLVLIFVSCDSDPYIVGQVKNEKEFRNALAEAKDGDSILIKAGSYTFDSDLEISKDVTLYVENGEADLNFKNKARLVATSELGDKNLVLDSLNIKGTFSVEGGGSNSIHLENVEVESVKIAKAEGEPPRLVIEGNTEIQQLTITTDAIIDVQTVFSENEPPIKKTEIVNDVEITLENAQSNAFGEMSDDAKENISCTQWDGKSKTTDWYTDSSDTYTLNSASDLAGLAELVNKGNDFAGKTIKLDSDIDLNNKLWTSIGKSELNKSFKGTFDGGNHTISNMRNYPASETGEFVGTDPGTYGGGFFSNTIGATIKNITFEDCISKKYEKDIVFGGNVYGIVAGYAYSTTVFENVHVNNCEVGGYGKVGGILGMAADPNGTTTFINCSVDNLTIEAVYDMGGLAGLVQNKLVVEDSTVGTIDWVKYSVAKYKDLNTTVVCGADCIFNGLKITGTYWDNGDYYWGGLAKYAVMYKSSSHDCMLENETLKMANSERMINDLSQLDIYNN